MKDLIIVGASGFGRELVQYVEDINDSSGKDPVWHILGFIDDNPHALNGVESDYPLIGNIQDHQPIDNAFYACALAFPKVKREIVGLLKNKGAHFCTLIHPTARISRHSKIGEGCIITPYSNVNADTEVGEFVSILASGIGHDAKVGDFSTLSGHVCLNGHAVIGNDVYVGCGALIAPSVRIGDGATVGIGSVVISKVRSGITVFGNPAKKLDI